MMKKEKGSITLFTLIAMMFFLTIAFTAYTSAMIKLQAQNEDLERIKASYEQDISPEALAKLYNELTGTREWLPGEGTEQNPYKIYTIEDLLTLSNKTNAGESYSGKYIELMNDLDFKNIKSYEKSDRTDFGDVNGNGTVEELRTELITGTGWQAIGIENRPFYGNFKGNDFTINNIYMNKTTNNQGLFGIITNSMIKDICVKGEITSTGIHVGGIAGYGTNGNVVIDNCKNYVNISCETNVGNRSYVGGIIGDSNGTIKNCVNYGNISSIITSTSECFVGGIAGNCNKAEKCTNFGGIFGNSINAAYSNVGGIAGYTMVGGYIFQSYNAGRVVGSAKNAPLIGGIAGVNRENCIISNCYNTGEIVSLKNTSFAGGIVGDNFKDNATVKKCYSIGKITVNSVERGVITGAHVFEASTEYSYGPSDYVAISNSTNNIVNCELKPRAEMKTQVFVDLLNTDQIDTPWAMDTANINNGYPILKWQLEQL